MKVLFLLILYVVSAYGGIIPAKEVTINGISQINSEKDTANHSENRSKRDAYNKQPVYQSGPSGGGYPSGGGGGYERYQGAYQYEHGYGNGSPHGQYQDQGHGQHGYGGYGGYGGDARTGQVMDGNIQVSQTVNVNSGRRY